MNEQPHPPPSPPGAARPLVLSVAAGTGTGTEIEVGETLLIGRHASGIGELANDADLSRRHALISRSAGGTYIIEDLGSTNGTFVNRERITPLKPLAAGDRIEVGNAVLLVRSIGSASVGDEGRTDTQAPPSQPSEAAPAPRVALRIEIDLPGRQVSIALDDGSDRVDLVHHQGRWQIATPD